MMQEQKSEIARLNAENDRLKAQMDGVRDHFVGRTADELPDRWDMVIRHWIANLPSCAKALGKDGLRVLLAEVDPLVPQANELAQKHLNGQKVWRHEREDIGGFLLPGSRLPYQPTGSGGARVWTHVSEPLMDAEDEVLPILKRHFHTEPYGKARSGGTLSPELVEIIQTYAVLDIELKDVHDRLEDLNQQVNRAEALSIWDSVKDETKH